MTFMIRAASYILLTLVVTLVVGGGAWWYINGMQAETISHIDQSLERQETVLVESLELLDRNSADVALSVVVRDCAASDRNAFDELLSRLDGGLSSTELDRLESLYHKCGDFFAVRRTVMADRFAQGVAHYETLLQLRAALTEPTDAVRSRLQSWQTIAQKETQISQYFSRLVAIQGEIITELRAGKHSDAQSIQRLLTEAGDIQGSIGVLTVEIDAAQNTLSGL